jgi:hypothetical protein
MPPNGTASAKRWFVGGTQAARRRVGHEAACSLRGTHASTDRRRSRATVHCTSSVLRLELGIGASDSCGGAGLLSYWQAR